MSENMTPPIKMATLKQIDKAVANYRAMLERYSQYFAVSAFQQVLGSKEFAKCQADLFRAYVEVVNNVVTRSASIDRTRSFLKAIEVIGGTQYLVREIVTTAPQAEGDAEFIFVNFGRDVACDKLDEELAKLGYELVVDPQGLAGINEVDRHFSEDYPNALQWKDAEGKNCLLVFNRWGGGHDVHVIYHSTVLSSIWWYPCRHKQVLDT